MQAQAVTGPCRRHATTRGSPDLNDLLHHVSTGAGAPALVFVHGLACASEDWAAQTAVLSARHHCIALDLPGHGASKAEGALGIARLGAAVAHTLEPLRLGPVVLVGHSMGCRVVLDAALRLGEDVVGLVLVDGSLRGAGEREAARVEARATVERAGFAPYMSGLFRGMFVGDADPELQAHIVRRALRLDAAAGTGLIADMAAWDAGTLAGALAAQTAPVLVVQSSGIDAARRRVPLAAGETTPFVELVRRSVAQVDVEVIPGIGHFTMHDAPEQLTAFIARFAAQVGAGIAQR